MTRIKGEKSYQFKALTDLWTGSVGGKPDRLITTGLLGSIRWWFEVLVRGLGGSACDPSDTKCEGKDHCVVCELFGCTGWARKFRFEVLDKNGDIRANQIKSDKPDQDFSLRFTPLRPIRIEEWTLLDATLRLIAGYGAIGGKTVFKPSDEPGRQNQVYHRDYGLIEIKQATELNGIDRIRRRELADYISNWRKVDHGEFAWASLQHFWHVKDKYLARQDADTSTFNQVIRRPGPKQRSEQKDSWIAGRRPDQRNNIEAESKKVFSFKNPPRTFGFVKPRLIDFDAMRQRLTNAWGQNGWDFLTGDQIMNQLFAKKEDHS